MSNLTYLKLCATLLLSTLVYIWLFICLSYFYSNVAMVMIDIFHRYSRTVNFMSSTRSCEKHHLQMFFFLLFIAKTTVSFFSCLNHLLSMYALYCTTLEKMWVSKIYLFFKRKKKTIQQKR